MSEQSFSVECAHCLRKFRWKPEFAGKRGKCKCGQPITFPQTAPSAVGQIAATAVAAPAAPANQTVEPLENNYDLAETPPPPVRPPPLPTSAKTQVCPKCTVMMAPTAVICTRCGYNTKTRKTMGTRIKGPGPDGVDIARAAGKVVLSMVLGGTVAVVSGAIWIAIMLLTHYQIGFIAWIIGLAVGGTMRLVNPNGGEASGWAAAGFAFLGLALPKALLVWAVLRANHPVYEAFTLLDGLWFTLAISTAYKMGRG